MGNVKTHWGVSEVGENFVLEQIEKIAARLAPQEGQSPRPFTGEGNQELATTLWTNDAGEAGFENSTIEIAEDGGIPEGSPEAVSSFESLFPKTLEGLEIGIGS